MQYEKYKVEDFLFDEFFVRWVKNPGPETEHFWESWIEKNPGKVETINKAREIVNSIQPKNEYDPGDKAYNEVLENILKQPASSWSQVGYSKKNDQLTSWVKYAAVFIIMICVGGLITYWNVDQPVEDQVSIPVQKQCPYGQKITFNLYDGTTVKLNAGSKLTYPETFGKEQRWVRLEGEAFFEVNRDESRPFIVETKDLITTVLGTSFNIKSYQDESVSLVAVASGKVKVTQNHGHGSSDSLSRLLEKNQMVMFDAHENVLTEIESIPEDVFAWKDNVLVFDPDDFESIINKMEKWYGVEFIINKDIKSFIGHSKGGKYQNEPLEIVLEGLKDQFTFEYQIVPESKKIIIN